MDIAEAQKCVSRERTRWFSVFSDVPDDELLRRRERWFNGWAMFFGMAVLPSYFWAGQFGIIGWWLCLAAEVLAARHYSKEADECRDARQALKGQTI
jgi:hypothetical protein